MTSWILKGGLVVAPGKAPAAKDVLIEDGRIVKVEPRLSAKHKELPAEDARGLWVLPGPVDMHVHFREPGGGGETIESGARAAAMGGVTTVLAMPNTSPPVDNPERLKWVIERSRLAKVNVLHAAAVTVEQKGERLSPLGALAETGAAAFSDDGRPVSDAALLRRALEFAKVLDKVLIEHCEDLDLSAGGVINEGAAAARLGLAGIPAASEAVAALRDIELCRLTGARLHIAHASCRETVDAVRRAKKQGLPVTAETCPHYFTLSDEDLDGFDAAYKMKPPLRSPEDVEAILEGLADGTLDALATDHAPHPAEAKALGLARAPFGIIGLETLLPLALSSLVHKKILGPGRLAELLSAGPARALGLKAKGSLAPGADADLAVVDPKASRAVPARFESASRNSPFIGRRLQGWPVMTVVGGRIVMKDGRWVE